MARRSLQRVAIAMAFVLLMITQSRAQVIYPEEAPTTPCQLRSGAEGRCLPIASCASAVLQLNSGERPVPCGFEGRAPVVCCPPPADDNGKAGDLQALQVSAPAVDFECGDSTPVEVPLVFGLSRVSRSNLQKDSLATVGIAPPENVPEVVGGFPARRVLAKYTRQSASVVRLGEHDYSTSSDGDRHEDFLVGEVVLHPEYLRPESYHDLALIKLGRRVVFNSHINPVCLPWGREAERDLTGEALVITGWGATEHGGASGCRVWISCFSLGLRKHGAAGGGADGVPPLPLRPELLDPPQYSRYWPRGIGNETLCAGDPQGGKDACQGDSGGPLVYLDERKRYVLAGVVSSGYGCGLQEFPGLYANLRQAPYLRWIKKVAFT
ncbi:serine proteinase [Penaeus vannamei]|uniref:Serine proteinase n=1 Tax=Penaeus vannamei TaxID=6689 RepID=A0A3R7PWN1_PENVA|nr:serine proteinase [Penaeus vannamei]